MMTTTEITAAALDAIDIVTERDFDRRDAERAVRQVLAEGKYSSAWGIADRACAIIESRHENSVT